MAELLGPFTTNPTTVATTPLSNNPTITVRQLDPVTWEPQNGNGQNNFISDLQAVAQIIATRLRLFEGEWFLNLSDGLPLFQSILGSSGSQRNIEIITNIISANILGLSPYVTGLNFLTATFQDRKYVFSAVVATQFGNVSIGNAPGLQASIST
jgi:hypothetical protein